MAQHTLNPANWSSEYRDFLINYAITRVSDRGTAEDVVQETFLSAWKGRKNFRGDCTERTWLTGVLRNKIVDLYRRNSRRPVTLETDIDNGFDDDRNVIGFFANRAEEGDAHDPSAVTDRAELLSLVNQAVDHMPETMGQAFRMRELEGRSTEEITEVLNISKNNLWVLIHRAKAAIKTQLEPAWLGTEAMPAAA